MALILECIALAINIFYCDIIKKLAVMFGWCVPLQFDIVDFYSRFVKIFYAFLCFFLFLYFIYI